MGGDAVAQVASDARVIRQIAQRRNRPVAVIALARKLAGILFAIWRDGTTYEANHATGRSALI
jgi:hypothetical protein